MPSPHSLRRLADLTKKVRNDLRGGGMAVNFRYLFRSTAILARVVEVLADHVATQAEQDAELEQAAEQVEEAQDDAGAAETGAAPGTTAPRRSRETIDR